MPKPNTIHLHSAQRALDGAFANMPEGPAYTVEVTLFVNVTYPGNNESVTLDSKRNDIESFTARLTDMAAAMQTAARAAADAGGEVDAAEAGVLVLGP